MLRIGVALPGRFEDGGDYLADARALDAAGVDSLWLDADSSEPWLVMGGIAAVTGRARLIAPVSNGDLSTPSLLAARIATLGRLSRGRAGLKLRCAPRASDISRLLDAVRSAGARQAIVELAEGGESDLPLALADGLVAPGVSPEACRALSQAVADARGPGGAEESFELWARCATPEDRGAWRRTLQDLENAGATGVLVPAGPRLLDILRNPDGDDDRSDLSLAQG